MNLKTKTGIWITVILLLALNLGLTAKSFNREKVLSQVIEQSLENFHYSEKKINDEFSSQVFGEYLKMLDYGKRFFLQSDIDDFKIYLTRIDDELLEGKTDLMNLASARLEQRIGDVMGFYHELLSRPFDFSRQESIELDGEKRSYCNNMEELKEYWRKIFKYNSLINYVNLSRAEKNNDFKPEREEKARKAVLKSFKALLGNLLQACKNDAIQLYFNALVQVFDPHTDYLPPKEKEDFDIEMTGKFEGIGALLREEDGFVKIASIIPGGPSWRQKTLQPGDLILKVAQGDEEPVDIVGMRVVDAVKLIRGKKGTLVNLTVKKPDEQILVVPLVRDVVIVEESFAKSAILRDEKLEKAFGYIYLPRFYRDFAEPGARNATDDVKAILDEFNRKKVDGLILDLRNNSGGSLIDAIQVSGLFIPKGPIVQVKNRQHGIRVLRDQDRKVEFSGPMVVLINALSASASEILAGALQDYNRAIIVGGNQSFGKGTVQIMLDLDRYLGASAGESKLVNSESLGALKLTVQKFYRVTGSSNQYRGIVPDIILPDRFDYLEIGEKYLDFSMPWDTIPPISFSKWAVPLPARDVLAGNSRKRIGENPFFRSLRTYLDKLQAARENTNKSLDFASFFAEQQRLLEEQKKIDLLQKEIPSIQILATDSLDRAGKDPFVEKKSGQQEQVTREIRQDWFKQLKKDMVLDESISILNDIITIHQ
jgi:carboxyl-terminal processing protease